MKTTKLSPTAAAKKLAELMALVRAAADLAGELADLPPRTWREHNHSLAGVLPFTDNEGAFLHDDLGGLSYNLRSFQLNAGSFGVDTLQRQHEGAAPALLAAEETLRKRQAASA